MFIKLLVLFIVVPIVEIYVLLSVGSMIGLWPTVALVLATGVSGAYLARSQGLAILMKIQQELAQGRMPAEELLDGALVLSGGLLLLTPGFCTDLVGFLLLAPFSRILLKKGLRRILQQMLVSGQVQVYRR